MAPLTRWVLAHKRIVVVTWIVLLFAGIAASGPASDALDQKFSVPNKEGWETNQAIAKHYRGTGGDTAPLLPVVTLPRGQSVSSHRVKAGLAQVDKRLARALPGARGASLSSTGGQAFGSKGGDTPLAGGYPRPHPQSAFRGHPQ